MKKGIIIWLIIIAIGIFVFFLLKKVPTPPDCEELTYQQSAFIWGGFKDFSFFLSFLFGAFFGWLALRRVEINLLKAKKMPRLIAILIFLFSYCGVIILIWAFFIYARKSGWLSLDVALCESFKSWYPLLIKVKSIFGKLGISNVYLAHSLDVLISYLVSFILFYFGTMIFFRAKSKEEA